MLPCCVLCVEQFHNVMSFLATLHTNLFVCDVIIYVSRNAVSVSLQELECICVSTYTIVIIVRNTNECQTKALESYGYMHASISGGFCNN